MGCHWEREERNGHGDPEKAVWHISMQGCCSSRSGCRKTAGPAPWDAVPRQCHPSWPQFRIRTHLTNVFCPKQRGAELSAGNLFSTLPGASLLQEGEQEPPCCGTAVPVKKSISDSWGKDAGEKLHVVSPALDKGSVPCSEGGTQNKRNSLGKAENSPSCWCEVLWHLIYEVFVPPGLFWETEAAALTVKGFCSE